MPVRSHVYHRMHYRGGKNKKLTQAEDNANKGCAFLVLVVLVIVLISLVVIL